MPPDPPIDTSRRFPSRWWLLALLIVIVIIFLFGPCQKAGEHRGGPGENPPPAAPPESLQTQLIPPAAPVSPSALSPAPGARPAVRPRIPRISQPPPDLSPRRVAGSVDSWEDWNSSFTDTVTRTYSVIFDSARLDTVNGEVVFTPSGTTLDTLRVKQVECLVDNVRPLIKYTFPGEKVNFVIGVGFAASVSWSGTLSPRKSAVRLDQFGSAERGSSDDASVARNQFIVVLHSPPGYSYTLRTAIECYVSGDTGMTRTYYTPPAAVEFRRMVRFQSLVRARGALYMVTNNPVAIRDVAVSAPGSTLEAVLVPLRDPSEADDLLKEPMPNVRMHVSAPRTLERSFVILSDSGALVERNVLDPDFKRTAELKLKGVELQQIGFPRITSLVTEPDSVQELRLLFEHYERLQPQ